MRKRLLALSVLAALASLPGRAGLAGEEKTEATIDNPRYKGWASFKPGSTVTHREEVKYKGAEATKLLPGGVEKRDVTYKLISVSKDRAVVETTVLEYNFLFSVQSAPTRITYPAKVPASYVDEFRDKAGLKMGKGEATVLGKTIPVNTLETTMKGSDGEVRHRKVWFTYDLVPGGVVKEESSASVKGEVVSTGSISILRYKAAVPKKPKKAD